MKSTCCGKRLHRLDLRPIVIKRFGRPAEHWGVQDTNPHEARWNCDVCGRIYTQRKRQKGVSK